ncbi:MAG: alkaline phosphatase family protein [Candidatus Hydrogenedentes bacterium]|nr:alkaline phosphatase family protein [Candidatus Hydrogenedentota bacterium]
MIGTRILPALLAALLLTCVSNPAHGEPRGTQVILIVMDGLRPDYVNPRLMPNLHALSREGVVFEKHHAAFPTVTRVNASTIATGTYPDRHGIVDNSVYFPGVEPDKTLSTGSKGDLEKINTHTGGNLLTAESLGEVLARQGKKTGVFSSGSSGSAYLLNHKVPNGLVINNGFILPESLSASLLPRMGETPPDASPNRERNARIVRTFLDYGLNELNADLSILWISDPDHTGHEYGMSTPETTQALRLADDEIGKIAVELKRTGRMATTNLLITSDHGFSTHTLKSDPADVIRAFEAAQGLPENSIILTGSCIYLKDIAKASLPALVATLQATPWVGPIFTRAKVPGSTVGSVEGTLALDVVREMHPERAPDIVFSPVWSDEMGATGFAGTVANVEVAGHGSASPWDVHNTLIALGPDFAVRRLSGIPSHAVDLAPTICHLLGVRPANTMEGRVLFEGLAEDDPNPPSEITTRTIRTEHVLDGGLRYQMEVALSEYRGLTYFDQAKGWRE